MKRFAGAALPPSVYRLPLICLLVAGLLACARPSLTLCTDRAELAAYTSVFNASQSDYWLHIVYHPRPAEALQDKSDADLLVGTGLSDPSLFPYLSTLSRLFRDDRIQRTDFYEDLVVLGQQDEKTYALPLNFSLPAVVFKPQAVNENVPPLLMPLAELKRMAAAFNVEDQEQLQSLGFSPLWYEGFLYLLAVSYGVDFRLGEGGRLEWNEESLDRAIAEAKAWLEDAGGGVEGERAFSAKYRNAPDYRLAEEERILFYADDIRSFLRIPREKRESLEFRWLSHENRIPVKDDILFIGVPKRAANRKGARFFLEWLFTPENQVKLLETNYRKRLQGVFGIANGFSALREVNEIDLPKPQYNPLFVGAIPTEEMLLFPPALPWDWQRTRGDVIVPWLWESVSGSGTGTSLRERLPR